MCSIGSGGGSGERGGAAPAGRAVVAPGAGADCCCAAADAARLPASRNARTILVFISRLRVGLRCAPVAASCLIQQVGSARPASVANGRSGSEQRAETGRDNDRSCVHNRPTLRSRHRTRVLPLFWAAFGRAPTATIPVPRRHVRLSISWGLVRRLGETHNRAEGAQPCDT